MFNDIIIFAIEKSYKFTMVVFKDFAQKLTTPPGWFAKGQLEPIQNTIQRMNNWIDEANPNIINIETVWTTYSSNRNYNEPIKYSMSDGRAYYALQIFRVWHKTDPV
jgi:hypothetical protein